MQSSPLFNQIRQNFFLSNEGQLRVEVRSVFRGLLFLKMDDF